MYPTCHLESRFSFRVSPGCAVLGYLVLSFQKPKVATRCDHRWMSSIVKAGNEKSTQRKLEKPKEKGITKKPTRSAWLTLQYSSTLAIWLKEAQKISSNTGSWEYRLRSSHLKDIWSLKCVYREEKDIGSELQRRTCQHGRSSDNRLQLVYES